MRRLAAAVCLSMTVALCAAAPAQAKALPGPAESYLFVVDGTPVKVLPGKGNAARIVIEDPDATRFSDRPFRHERPMSVAGMLGEFDWSAKTHRLAPATPNAAISVAGRSQIVDIRKAWTFPDRLVLSVRGLKGPLTAAQGPGSIFIDNTVTFPMAQTVALGGDSSAQVTLIDATTVSVQINAPGDGWGFPPQRTLSPSTSLTANISQVNSETQYFMSVLISADFTASGVSLNFIGALAPPPPSSMLTQLEGTVAFEL